MRTKEDLDRLRERAIALRREGKSRTEIQAILGLADRGTLDEFLRGVPPPDAVGISRSDLSFCMQIHESADVATAQRFWIEVTGSKDEQFLRPTLKRHNPKTTRKNVGDGYHGCLRIEVRRGTRLCGRIEGWATAVMAGLSAESTSPVSW